jgi:hypothetical protein
VFKWINHHLIKLCYKIFAKENDSWNFEKESNDEEDKEAEPEIPSDELQATWSSELQPKLKSKDDIIEFNRVPGIYAIIMACQDGKYHMVTFAYLDCSALLLQGGCVSCRSPVKDGITLDMKLEAPNELLPLNTLIPLEPLVLDIDRCV